MDREQQICKLRIYIQKISNIPLLQQQQIGQFNFRKKIRKCNFSKRAYVQQQQKFVGKQNILTKGGQNFRESCITF